MPNKNYLKGRRKEYKIKDKLKRYGCDITLRSAGSHSPIDVIGIKKESRKIFFVQSKPESMSQRAKTKLYTPLEWLNGSFECVFYVE